jgi:hypothetical protein
MNNFGLRIADVSDGGIANPRSAIRDPRSAIRDPK